MARSDRTQAARARGATLIEVLVGCGVFTFLMLSSIAIMNIGTGGYRGVESKADVARQLNKFEADITTELKRASRASVGVYTPTSDYRWALWFTTNMNALDAVDATLNPTVPLGNSLIPMTDPNGDPLPQRYILYYVTRMDRTLHEKEYGYACQSYGSDTGPDTTCPHKWIVKKEVYLKQGQTSGNDTIGVQSDPQSVTNLQATSLHLLRDSPSVTLSALTNQCDSVNVGSVVHRAQVVAQNVLSFEITRLALASDTLSSPVVSANGPIVLFDVKVFKTLQAGRHSSAGAASVASVQFSSSQSTPAGNLIDVSSSVDATGTVTVHTNSSMSSSASAFTIQLDNRVIPQNP